jgi:hypothetical protein
MLTDFAKGLESFIKEAGLNKEAADTIRYVVNNSQPIAFAEGFNAWVEKQAADDDDNGVDDAAEGKTPVKKEPVTKPSGDGSASKPDAAPAKTTSAPDADSSAPKPKVPGPVGNPDPSKIDFGSHGNLKPGFTPMGGGDNPPLAPSTKPTTAPSTKPTTAPTSQPTTKPSGSGLAAPSGIGGGAPSGVSGPAPSGLATPHIPTPPQGLGFPQGPMGVATGAGIGGGLGALGGLLGGNMMGSDDGENHSMRNALVGGGLGATAGSLLSAFNQQPPTSSPGGIPGLHTLGQSNGADAGGMPGATPPGGMTTQASLKVRAAATALNSFLNKQASSKPLIRKGK